MVDGGDVDDPEVGFVVAELDRAIRSWFTSLRGHSYAVRAENVARLLVERGVFDELVARWEAADREGDAVAARRMGWVLAQRGDGAGAEAALRRGGQRGDLDSWKYLRELCRRRGDRRGVEEAAGEVERAARRLEESDRVADEHGDAEAAYRNGDRIQTAELVRVWDENESRRRDAAARGRGRVPDVDPDYAVLAQAAAAWERAALRGSADGAAAAASYHKDNLSHTGDPEKDRRRLLEVARWCRRADELGHPDGSWRLGMVLSDLGDLSGAEAAYRRAERRGNQHAASNLAVLLEQRGDLDGAEAAYRRAFELDYDDGHGVELGFFLEKRGDQDGAAAVWEQVRARRARDRGRR